jgi:hypothetical protein
MELCTVNDHPVGKSSLQHDGGDGGGSRVVGLGLEAIDFC